MSNASDNENGAAPQPPHVINASGAVQATGRNIGIIQTEYKPQTHPPVVEPPWWLAAGRRQRPFPHPLAYGFFQPHPCFGLLRFSLRPGPGGSWLLQLSHPWPDARVDFRLDVDTLLDRNAVAAVLAAHCHGVHARVIGNSNRWEDWMRDLVAVAAKTMEAAE